MSAPHMFAVRGLGGFARLPLAPESPRPRALPAEPPRWGRLVHCHTGVREASTDGSRMEFTEKQVTLEVLHIRVERAKTITAGCGFESST